MAFWKKKSEDPWDIDPNRPKKAAITPEPEKEPEKPIPSWVHKTEKPEPILCPWCVEPMIWGNLYAKSGAGMQTYGQYLQWREGECKGFLDSLRFTGQMVDMGYYEEAWYCTKCRKLVMDVGLALESSGPNYVWENGKVKLPTEDLDETEET